MYARMKVVYENNKSFVMEVCAPDKDEFYTQLFKIFESAKCNYNPDDWGQFGIKHVEVQCISEQMNDFVTHDSRAERTCHDVSVDKSTQFYCSECECTVDIPLLWGKINYCPNCGCKVIIE